ncbi:MAG: M1 family metallopeptidase [Bacteroidales bacterium]|nr:M1 family metallopeptidase [Bacteroidales bacterium]
MKMKLFVLYLFVSVGIQLFAQNNLLPLNIQKAYDKGTRSEDGKPGPNYRTNSADYKMDIILDTKTDILKGTSEIQYYNNSADTLKHIVFRLYGDFFKKAGARQWAINPGDLSDGVQISKLSIDEEEYDPESDFPDYWITNMRIRLKQAILPGTSTTINLEWTMEIPTQRGLRMCKYGDGHYFIAYWYPQIAVYDDVDGWDVIEYYGMVEFYNDINNYEVNIRVPGDYVVWATGELQNMDDVLQSEIVNRYKKAKESDAIINIIRQEDYENKAVTKKAKQHKWRFTADNVPDFSFALSNKSNWDGTSLIVDNTTGRRVLTDVVYPEGSKHWTKGAEVSKASVAYMSNTLPGVPFPYPHMTSVWNGNRGGGMETPMMANNGAPENYDDFVELIFHEISHTYFPFYMGTNERKYAWMDEGWAAYLPNELSQILTPEADYLKDVTNGYLSVAGQEIELPLMVPSFQHNSFTSGRVAAYTRPAMAYHFLRNAIGDELFKDALREYINRWHGKHPLPYDFFNTFEDVAGEDLDWFWKPWFFEAGYPDLGIKEVTENNEIVVEKIGTHPIPVELVYELKNNKSNRVYKPTSVWKNGQKEVRFQLPENAEIVKVILGNDHIPDVDKSNNVWEKK